MSVSSDTRGAGRKLPRRLGGMAEALAIASDLGVPIPAVQNVAHKKMRVFGQNYCYFERCHSEQ
ncbi:hypothetical protein B296_00045432, partial [Ensete ventricosum]